MTPHLCGAPRGLGGFALGPPARRGRDSRCRRTDKTTFCDFEHGAHLALVSEKDPDRAAEENEVLSLNPDGPIAHALWPKLKHTGAYDAGIGQESIKNRAAQRVR